MDCACFAYDGNAVYGTPRGLASLLTQVITVDLLHFSPTYVHRLIKYSKRGFELYWPQLDRSLVNIQKLQALEENPTWEFRYARKMLGDEGAWNGKWMSNIKDAYEIVGDWIECRDRAGKSEGLERLLIAETHPYVFYESWLESGEAKASFGTAKIPWGKKWHTTAVIQWVKHQTHFWCHIGEMEEIAKSITFREGNAIRRKYEGANAWWLGAYDAKRIGMHRLLVELGRAKNSENRMEIFQRIINEGGTYDQIDSVRLEAH